MGLPSTFVSFRGREIVRIGRDGAWLVDFGSPQVERKTATHQFCEAEHSVCEDLGGQLVSLAITVSRDFATPEQKRRWVMRHLATVCKGAGELKVIENGEVYTMANAIMSVETVTERGVGIDLKYTFKGGELRQLYAKTKG